MAIAVLSTRRQAGSSRADPGKAAGACRGRRARATGVLVHPGSSNSLQSDHRSRCATAQRSVRGACCGRQAPDRNALACSSAVRQYIRTPPAKDDKCAGRSLLAVGGVRYNADASRIAQQRGYKLDNLPGSRDEAIAAADVLAPILQERLLLEGREATETAVKQAVRTPRTLIHLGVHGIASDQPDRGALVFLPDASAGEDGLLEVPEIVRLRLRSDLAVLSACDTAVGTVQGQEGVANLSRAFLLAGSRSVVSTLWAIDDAFSATLMRSFYSSLAARDAKGCCVGRCAAIHRSAIPGHRRSLVLGRLHARRRWRRASGQCGGESIRPQLTPCAQLGQQYDSSMEALSCGALADVNIMVLDPEH